MVKIPKFYYKVGTLTSGEQKGKKAWLVSNRPTAEFKIHPAFLDGSKEIDQLYIGKYETVDDSSSGSTKLASIKNKFPVTNISLREIEKRCNARNGGGAKGFHNFNMLELGMIQMLCIIEIATTDVQEAIAQGNVATRRPFKTGASDSIWRGIYDLWGNHSNFISGIEIDKNNNILLQNPYGSLVNTNQKATETRRGYAISVNNTLKEIFFPYALGEASQGSFADSYQYQNANVNNVLMYGAEHDDYSYAGLFYYYMYFNKDSEYRSGTGRLAKR